MRRIAFTAAAVFALFAPPLAAQEHEPLEWQEYAYPELGIAKEFPASPQRQTGKYQTEVVGENAVPSVVYFVDFGDLIFQMTVVDLRAPEHVLRAANILAECIFLAESAGLPLAMKPRPNHSGVVDDHEVTRGQTVWEIAELTVEHCVGAHL
jgi:hypothetical protein